MGYDSVYCILQVDGDLEIGGGAVSLLFSFTLPGPGPNLTR